MPPRRTRPPLPLWLSEWGDAPEGWIAGVDEVGRGPLAGPVVAAAVVFLAIVCDLCSTLYVSDTCGTSLAAAAPINGGVCVARVYETMRTYIFFARCYHWTAWFLDLFTDPIFGQLYAFCLAGGGGEGGVGERARSRAGRREAGGPGRSRRGSDREPGPSRCRIR